MYVFVGVFVAINAYLIYRYFTNDNIDSTRNTRNTRNITTQTLTLQTSKKWQNLRKLLYIKRLKDTIRNQRINKVNLNKYYLSTWKNNIAKVNNELMYINNYTLHRVSMNETLKSILNKDHYLYWESSENVKTLKSFKCIVIDINNLYDYTTKTIDSVYLTFIKYLSKLCHKNKILFYIIGELHPNNLSSVSKELTYYNENNYVSPYNYTQSLFSQVKKLPFNKVNNKATNVSVSKILNDIVLQYNFSLNELGYIGNNYVPNVNCIELV